MASARMGAQTAILAAGAFVAGIVAGGIGPRGEVRRLEAEVFELQRAATRGPNAPGRQLATLITQGLEGADAATPPGRRPAPPQGDTDGQASSPEPDDVDAEGFERALRDGADEPIDDGAPLEAAREMLELRRDQAYRALREQADPDPAQLEAIDGALADMNVELTDMAHELVDQVMADGTPNRRDTMALGADVLDLMVRTEDRMLGSLSPDQRARLGDDVTDPTAFIDPGVVEILQRLEGMER